MLDFTIGLTEGVAWPWPIAVYLFLAGISGGAVARCDLCEPFQRRSPQHTHHEGGDFDRFYYDRSRHDLLGTDLTNPLFFWRFWFITTRLPS